MLQMRALWRARFNPRARVGRDRGVTWWVWRSWSFNPRARVGRDGRRNAGQGALFSFNPRARVGRDSMERSVGLPSLLFQSTRPRGARRRSSSRLRRPTSGFNPRARVGRDQLFPHVELTKDQFQSTRPRGARRVNGCRCSRSRRVSIHAPAWGATCRSRRMWCGSTGFNPRARVGRDAETMPGVTVTECFNPRARVGRDAMTRLTIRGICVRFNPRARVGRDLARRMRSSHHPRFNPRARVGRDRTSWPEFPKSIMFQSTRPRGARPVLQHALLCHVMFQSTRPRGARQS